MPENPEYDALIEFVAGAWPVDREALHRDLEIENDLGITGDENRAPAAYDWRS